MIKPVEGDRTTAGRAHNPLEKEECVPCQMDKTVYRSFRYPCGAILPVITCCKVVTLTYRFPEHFLHAAYCPCVRDLSIVLCYIPVRQYHITQYKPVQLLY